MNYARIIVIIALLGIGAGSAKAEPPYFNDMPPDTVTTYTHRIEPDDTGYDIAFRCQVEPFSFGVVTLSRAEGPRASRHDLEVANIVTRSADGRLVATDIISASEGGTGRPQVAVILPNSEAISYPFVIHARDELKSSYRVYCHSVNVPKILAMAGLKTAGIALIRGWLDNQGFDNKNPNVERALNLAWSAIVNKDVMSVGIDTIKHEFKLQLDRQSPDTPSWNFFIVEVLGDLSKELYQDAFYELSAYR